MFARLYICLLVKRTDKIESGGTKLRMCPMISLGISTSVMAGGADSGCDPKVPLVALSIVPLPT